ncbi:MAG: heme NO-binding domain-containing protein [Chitinophagaceae bacterium]|nr:heme NO-binding domain-containing protein [Chitinophagaceae bacterium]
MKGMVFTGFLEMVENQFGFVTASKIVNESNLQSKGVYTSVGTYDHKEIVNLVVSLSNNTGIPIPDLLEAFGKYLFAMLAKSYPQMINRDSGLFAFLSKIDNYIHPEVLKLYPDAELPRFSVINYTESELVLTYHSARKMEHLALGLFKGSIDHFSETATVDMEPLSTGDTKFILRK